MSAVVKKVPSWFVCWACGCADVRTDPAALPAVCPGHGRERIVAEPERLQVLEQFVDSHDCGSRLCAEAVSG